MAIANRGRWDPNERRAVATLAGMAKAAGRLTLREAAER